MKTFSCLWSDKLGAALRELATEPFPLEFHQGSDDFKALLEAVNQGIDAHLEAIFFTESPGTYGRRRFTVNPESVPVLVRRLLESGDDNAASLASGICSCLEIELI